MKASFLVTIESGRANYSVYSPDLLGCIATGKTLECALEEMRSAIEFHLEGMVDNGEQIPRPKSLSNYLQKSDEISPDDILTSIEVESPENVPT